MHYQKTCDNGKMKSNSRECSVSFFMHMEKENMIVKKVVVIIFVNTKKKENVIVGNVPAILFVNMEK